MHNGGVSMASTSNSSSNGGVLPPAPLGTVLFDNPVVESADEDIDDEDDNVLLGNSNGMMRGASSVDRLLMGYPGVGGSSNGGVGAGGLLPGGGVFGEYGIRGDGDGGDGGGGVGSQGNGGGGGHATYDRSDPIYFLTSTVSRSWEYVNVSLTRIPGYGFGIAVSGGCDNPHFANGDPAIAISDVLKGGPAQGKLQINDRIISANGISLDNVDYSTAVQILRDSGPSVSLRVKRRVNPQSYKVSVPINSKRLKKLSFESLGFTVSVTLQIKTVDSPSLGLREGDIIDKIQGMRVNDLFNEKIVVKELKRVIEESSNGSTANLNLTVKRSGSNRQNTSNQQQQQQQSQLQQPSHSVGNLYVQPPTRNPNNKSFDSTNTPLPPPPPPPPRPPLPSEFEVPTQHHQQQQQQSGGGGGTMSPLPPPPPQQLVVQSPLPPQSQYHHHNHHQQHQQQQQLRSINFIKQNQLGIRLSGGNKSGIIVSAVQKNSQAQLQGLTPGDQIIRVNEHDFTVNPPTREQAIEILSGIHNDTLCNLTVQKATNPNTTPGTPGNTNNNNNDNQDEFYVRTRVTVNDDVKLHQVLLVTDTLVNGMVGQWEAYRVDAHGNQLKHEKLVIPNMKGGRELLKKSWKRTTSFRNREYEDLLQVAPATEPYEIVVKSVRDVHTRPVILYTPLNASIIECLMMIKQSSRLFKVVRSVDELDFNDGRVRVVTELVSVRGIQELYERRVFPFVVFANFQSKELLKEAAKEKYSKAKKIFSVLHKVREKLGAYVDMEIQLRDCEGAADSIYNAVMTQEGSGGRVFFKQVTTPSSPQSPQQQQQQTPQQSTPTRRSHSSRAQHSSRSNHQHHTSNNNNDNTGTLHRPSTSTSSHTRHKSTDSLAGPSLIASPQQQQAQQQQHQTPTRGELNSNSNANVNVHHPTSPSPASVSSLKFPNFNIPPPNSVVLEQSQTPQQTYEKRPNLHRSPTSVEQTPQQRQQVTNPLLGHHLHHHQQQQQHNLNANVNGNVLSSPSSHHLQNNFAHSPVLERRDYETTTMATTRRAQSNPPPGTSRNLNTSTTLASSQQTPVQATPSSSVFSPPVIDRSKKPTSSNPNVFYPIGNHNNNNSSGSGSSSPTKSLSNNSNSNNNQQQQASSSKPLPPPKPKLIPRAPEKYDRRNATNTTTTRSSRHHQGQQGDGGGDAGDDLGQTYLNIPMNSKAAQQQQQQQQFADITSGYFDWRGGRLVQKHVLGGQIPIEVFIPERAIPHGETIQVWFQVVDYNIREDTSGGNLPPTPGSRQNNNPHSQKKMLSPLVKFGPENYRFQIPVEIRIPQYSTNTSSNATAASSNIDNGNMLAKVLINNHSDYWTKIDIQNGNFPHEYQGDVKVVSLTVQQF